MEFPPGEGRGHVAGSAEDGPPEVTAGAVVTGGGGEPYSAQRCLHDMENNITGKVI